MTYTEVIVARKLAAYLFILFALIVVCLLLLNVKNAFQIIAYVINFILITTMIIYFISLLRRSRTR